MAIKAATRVPVRTGDLSPWRNPYVGAASAAVLLLATLAIVITLVGPSSAPAPLARISLQAPVARAPEGWREALKPLAATPAMSRDAVRYSENPLTPGAALAWNSGAAPAAQADGGLALPPAPIAGLFAEGPGGPLPIIATDGRTPFDAYRRPFTSNGRPKVALVIGGLGLNARATQAAIQTLPPQITLSFVSYADGLQGWIDMARAHGHEVLLETPMEPVDYPDHDPGPYTLMTAASPAETGKRLEWVLSRASGYFGLTNYLGSRFLADERAYAGFAAAVKGRGLAFIDDGVAARRAGGVPRATAERIIDKRLSGTAIDQSLLALESGALQRGQALGSGFAYPVTIEKVRDWAKAVEQRGYQLAPASALANRQ